MPKRLIADLFWLHLPCPREIRLEHRINLGGKVGVHHHRRHLEVESKGAVVEVNGTHCRTDFVNQKGFAM